MERRGRPALQVARRRAWRNEKYFAEAHFFLACRGDSCMLRMRTRFIFWKVTPRQLAQRQERDSLRRTRVKIEFFNASRPATCPRNSNTKKTSRYAYALATGRR